MTSEESYALSQRLQYVDPGILEQLSDIGVKDLVIAEELIRFLQVRIGFGFARGLTNFNDLRFERGVIQVVEYIGLKKEDYSAVEDLLEILDTQIFEVDGMKSRLISIAEIGEEGEIIITASPTLIFMVIRSR